MANLEQQLHIINADLIKFDKDRKAYTTHYDKLRKTIYDTLKTEEPLNKWLNGHKLGGEWLRVCSSRQKCSNVWQIFWFLF